MKKKILLLMGLLSVGVMRAQIAINTDAPASGTLINIDPFGNNSSSSSNKYDDDIVVDNNGNMGIGTVSPQTKLHIVSNSGSAFRLVDGTQGNKKLLICKDTNGTGEWGEAVFSNFGTIPFAQTTLTGSQILGLGVAYYTGLSYTFAKSGVYSISITAKVAVNRPNAVLGRWAQILPTSSDIATVWGASAPRFNGAYEVNLLGSKLVNTPTASIAYFAFNQTLAITEANRTIYFCMTSPVPVASDIFTFSWGVSATDPAPNGDSQSETSGSFIKIN
jgi:hypothetical protein